MLSFVGKFAQTKPTKDVLAPARSIPRMEFVSDVSGVNLILTIRGSSESRPEARMVLTTRSQIRYDRATQSANTRRSSAAGPPHRVNGMTVHH